jgi:hypothetical protein
MRSATPRAPLSRGGAFASLEEQNSFLEHWETHWAPKRIDGSAKRQVEAMFQEERPALGPLPSQGLQYFTQVECTVGDDTCVRVDHSSYAARPARIGSRVLMRLFEHQLEIRDRLTHALLRTHPGGGGGGHVPCWLSVKSLETTIIEVQLP